MNKNSTFEALVKPVIVLTVICIVVSGLLAVTNGVTAPIIKANTEATANAARVEILPEADSFTKLDYTDADGIITEVYAADNGAGYVISGSGKGYGGALPVMVGISADGTITMIKVMDNDETPGVGKKTQEASFTDQFTGKDETLDGVTTISGATISSTAVLNVVEHAFVAYNTVTEA